MFSNKQAAAVVEFKIKRIFFFFNRIGFMGYNMFKNDSKLIFRYFFLIPSV